MAFLAPIRQTPRPTMEEIVSLKSDYMDYHAKRISQNRQDELFFKMKFQVPSPDGRSPLIAPSAYQVVEELINHVAAENPIFNVLRRTQEESEIRRAEKLTSWINGYWQSSDITLLLRRMLWFDCVRGCHVMRLIYDPGLWPLEPRPPVKPADPGDIMALSEDALTEYANELAQYQDDKERYKERYADWKQFTEERCPILTQPLDPMYCFWEPGDDPKKVFIVWDRPVDDIIKEHPEMYDDLRGVKSGTKLQWNEYYDEYEYAYWVESYGSRAAFRNNSPPNSLASYFTAHRNTMLTVQDLTPHRYGFFPFIIDGPWVTPLQEPDCQYPSMYFAIKSMLQYESTLLTQIAHMIRVNGWAPLIVKTDRADAQKPVIDMSPGVVNYIELEEDARYLEFSGQTMNVLDNLIQAVNQYTSKGSGLGDILQGAPKGKSGYQQAQLAAMARVALVPIEHSTQRTLRTASRYVFKLIRVMEEPITILGQYGDLTSEATLRPKDVAKIGMIDVRLKTVMPIDDGAKIANLNNMNKAGWISRETAARLAGVENPEEEHARWVAEEIAKLPDVMQAQALQYVQEHWPELFQILITIQGQAKQKDGGGGPQMGPGGPGGAGGGAQPSKPGERPNNGPGSEGEMDQVVRQGQTGGMTQKRLPGGEG